MADRSVYYLHKYREQELLCRQFMVHLDDLQYRKDKTSDEWDQYRFYKNAVRTTLDEMGKLWKLYQDHIPKPSTLK